MYEKVKNTDYVQRHDVCAAAALLTLDRSNEILVGQNPLSNLLKDPIELDDKLVENLPIKNR